ncbi:MAG TPA: RluA family pseudouridine synthase [Tepidisphaeraceae bacterium]|jgi:23S rRNA pseudouridine955/2504/2580 synthase/23S rRNA pseudouridine1911/1915/1917 synthase
MPRPVSDELELLWSDDDYIAVQKPAGLATIPGRAEVNSVLEQLGEQLKLPVSGADDPRVRVVHRLDKDTSGVLVFAKHRAAQQHLSHQFRNNLLQKEYMALVVGRPIDSSGTVDAPLGPHPKSPKHMTVLKHGGRPARTEWKLGETFRHYSLLRCFPKTGKTHQIRVHLKHAGLPLAIDPLYNPDGKPILLSSFKRGYRPNEREERPLIDRLTLHAHRLTFVRMNEESVTVEAELPKDFRAALNMLRKYSSR